MEKFKQNKERHLICPWCPEGAVTVLIENCPHNPFKLRKALQESENKLTEHYRAYSILEDLKELMEEIGK
jgi:hypothetical protein